MAKFFKSTWFKCIFTLLAIAVVASGLLALLNDLLFISPEERTARAIKKIYGYEVSNYEVLLDVDSTDANVNKTSIENENGFGEIDKIYLVGSTTAESYEILFRATGNKGYKGGTITLWVKVDVTNDLEAISPASTQKISKVVMDSYDKQTLMSKLGNSFYDKFLVDVTDNYDSLFAADGSQEKSNPITGATKSANAACNAVNCVIEYLQDWGA